MPTFFWWLWCLLRHQAFIKPTDVLPGIEQCRKCGEVYCELERIGGLIGATAGYPRLINAGRQ